MLPELGPSIPAQRNSLAEEFQNAAPFRHLVVDGFLDETFAQDLLREFPAFDESRAINESGEVGRKAVVERIRFLGGAYRRLDSLVSSAEFLALISQLTGIPELLYDAHYFGGGTHDNLDGQDLDPHVDFNKHPVDGTHRRLNLIVYLNRDWDETWGGSLQLHSDPRADDDRIESVAPLFNRCVIFETTESSWHGFSRIRLPADKQQISRKSIALYFYTRKRPAAELADTHSTIYVDRPLPERIAPGYVLEQGDVDELRVLLSRRDQHNQRLYKDLTALQARVDQANAALHGGWLGRLRYLAGRLLLAIKR